MGNCAGKTAEKPPNPPASRAKLVVYLNGHPASPDTSLLDIALSYKEARVVSAPSTTTPTLSPTVRIGGEDTVTGAAESIMGYIDAMLPGPTILAKEMRSGENSAAVMGMVAELHHRSVVRHLEKMLVWVEEAVKRARSRRKGGCREVDAGRGSPRMEMKRFGRCYSQLLEIMLEHARMEERIVFPVLEFADRGYCKSAYEHHGRDLPIMNGIREAIKSIIVLDSGKPSYQEALLNLSKRLKTLLRHCKEHFEEEERSLLPILDVAVRSAEGEGGDLMEKKEVCMERVMLVMEGTHSHLFHILIAGLLPHESMQYLEIVRSCSQDKDRVTKMFQSLKTAIEGASSSFPPMLCNLFGPQSQSQPSQCV